MDDPEVMCDRAFVVLNSTKIETAWTEFTDFIGSLGFDRAIYAATRNLTHGKFGDLSDAVVVSNHDPAYIAEYLGDNHYASAPMMRWASENRGVCSWEWMHQRRKNGETSTLENQIMDFNARWNVLAGYTIVFEHASSRTVSGVGICARQGISQAEVDEIWSVKGREIEFFARLVDLRILSLPFKRIGKELTQRQREVLQWVADGKTTQEIAIILGLMPVTVEKHLRLAREVLNADTTAQAVAKASLQNQIFYLDPAPRS